MSGSRVGDAAIREVIWELLRLETFAAEARLREINAARRHGLQHRHGQQIRRIEEYFERCAGRGAWPADFQPGQLIHFREVLGGLLSMAPLRIYLDDLKADAGVRRSLLYYLSTEQGKRASRWEMLALAHKQTEYESEKARWAEEAKSAFARIFGDEGSGKPAWVQRLEDEARQLEHLLPLTVGDAERAEMRQRLGFIKRRLRDAKRTDI